MSWCGSPLKQVRVVGCTDRTLSTRRGASGRGCNSTEAGERLGYEGRGLGGKALPCCGLVLAKIRGQSRAQGGEVPYVELHLGVAVAALDAELLEVAEHVEQLPLALVHEDAPVEFHQLRGPPEREVDVADWKRWGRSCRVPVPVPVPGRGAFPSRWGHLEGAASPAPSPPGPALTVVQPAGEGERAVLDVEGEIVDIQAAGGHHLDGLQVLHLPVVADIDVGDIGGLANVHAGGHRDREPG